MELNVHANEDSIEGLPSNVRTTEVEWTPVEERIDALGLPHGDFDPSDGNPESNYWTDGAQYGIKQKSRQAQT